MCKARAVVMFKFPEMTKRKRLDRSREAEAGMTWRTAMHAARQVTSASTHQVADSNRWRRQCIALSGILHAAG